MINHNKFYITFKNIKRYRKKKEKVNNTKIGILLILNEDCVKINTIFKEFMGLYYMKSGA